MRILKDFKIPNFKFPKLKMDNLSKIDNVEVNYEDVKKAEEYKKRRKSAPSFSTQLLCAVQQLCTGIFISVF